MGDLVQLITHNGVTVPKVEAGLYWFNGELVWAEELAVTPTDDLIVNHIVLDSDVPGAIHARRFVSVQAWRTRARKVFLRSAIPNTLRNNMKHLYGDVPEQCGTCHHYTQVIMNRGQCDHPEHEELRGRTIYEHEPPAPDCPMR